MTAEVTVITLTRLRPKLLERAIESVLAQDCDATVEHLVIVDHCPETCKALDRLKLPPNVRWELMLRQPWECSGPGRSSRIRNEAVRMSRSRWIAFLDDDNYWDPDHLQSLLDCARSTGCRAVHSHMRLVHPDGRPYLDRRFPWCRDEREAVRLYAELCDRGVFTPGSNVVRDRADPLGHPDPVRSVDTGEWLLNRSLLLQFPFRDDFSEEDEYEVVGEDDKLLADLVAARVPVACTRKATLIYSLGGYSNNFAELPDASFAWR